MDGAQQVANAFIAQWVAEDMLPANAPEEGVADECKEEGDLEADEEVSSVASVVSG